jgi:hypothetical protein
MIPDTILLWQEKIWLKSDALFVKLQTILQIETRRNSRKNWR